MELDIVTEHRHLWADRYSAFNRVRPLNTVLSVGLGTLLVVTKGGVWVTAWHLAPAEAVIHQDTLK